MFWKMMRLDTMPVLQQTMTSVLQLSVHAQAYKRCLFNKISWCLFTYFFKVTFCCMLVKFSAEMQKIKKSILCTASTHRRVKC